MPPLLLSGRGITDADRAGNDTHSAYVVLSVLGIIAVYLYLFTHISLFFHLPMPEDLAHSLNIWLPHIFDKDHNVDSNLVIQLTQMYPNNDAERMVYFFLLVGAFISAYYLPLAYKQTAIVLWAILTIGLLYGMVALSGMLCAHITVYLVLHPKRDEQALFYGGLPGIFLSVAMLLSAESSPLKHVSYILLPIVTALVYRFIILPLLERDKAARIVRTVVMQSAIITVFFGTLFNGFFAEESWKLPLGLLLFFWHWERLIMYHIDYKDHNVPIDVTPFQYLSVFFAPGGIPNIIDRVCIAQGYSYVHSKFLCKQKNIIVMDGVKLLALSLGYLVFGDWLVSMIVELVKGSGLPVFGGSIKQMMTHFKDGEQIGSLSVLAVSLLNLFKWFVFFAGIAHFKVGVWRICGYDIATSFDRPWMATNLVEFWRRFTFHYREFLVRAFYYPAFFRFFKKHKKTRIVFATMAAAAFGNLVWGHVVELMYYQGMKLSTVDHVLVHWPYFFLLGAGISVAELYLLTRRRRRRAWTMDRWLLTDVLAAYATMQYFALIHIFARPAHGSTVWDEFQLFLLAFGIHL